MVASPKRRLLKAHNTYLNYLKALNNFDIDAETISQIEARNELLESVPAYRRTWETQKTFTSVAKIVERKYDIVPPKFYIKTWETYGSMYIGFPIGIVLFIIYENYQMIVSGISFGFLLGVFYGYIKDKKAKKNGKQISI